MNYSNGTDQFQEVEIEVRDHIEEDAGLKGA